MTNHLSHSGHVLLGKRIDSMRPKFHNHFRAALPSRYALRPAYEWRWLSSVYGEMGCRSLRKVCDRIARRVDHRHGSLSYRGRPSTFPALGPGRLRKLITNR